MAAGAGDGLQSVQTTSSVTTNCSDVWTYWGQQMTGALTGSNILSNIWSQWCVTTGASSNNVNVIWANWITVGNVIRVIPVASANQPTEAEQQAMAAARCEYKAREAQRQAAEKRARALLAAHLDEGQRDDLEKRHYFEVLTRHHRHRYRVGATGGVRRLDEKGQEVESFCIHEALGLYLPVSDSVLAKALLLEADEEQFLKIANKTVLRRAS